MEAITHPFIQSPEEIFIKKEELQELCKSLIKLTYREQTNLLYWFGFSGDREQQYIFIKTVKVQYIVQVCCTFTYHSLHKGRTHSFMTSRKMDIISNPLAVSRLSLAAIKRTLYSSKVHFNSPTLTTSCPMRLWSLIMTVATFPARISSSIASRPGHLKVVPCTPSSVKCLIFESRAYGRNPLKSVFETGFVKGNFCQAFVVIKSSVRRTEQSFSLLVNVRHNRSKYMSLSFPH